MIEWVSVYARACLVNKLKKMNPEQNGKRTREELEGWNLKGSNPNEALPFDILNYVAEVGDLSREDISRWRKAAHAKNTQGMVHKDDEKKKEWYYEIGRLFPEIQEKKQKYFALDTFPKITSEIDTVEQRIEELKKELMLKKHELLKAHGKAYKDYFIDVNDSTKSVYEGLIEYLEDKRRTLSEETPEPFSEQPLGHFDPKKKLDIKDLYGQLETVVETFDRQQSFSIIKLISDIIQISVNADHFELKCEPSTFVYVSAFRKKPEWTRVTVNIKLKSLWTHFSLEISGEIVVPIDEKTLTLALRNSTVNFDQYLTNLHEDEQKEYNDLQTKEIKYKLFMDEEIKTGYLCGSNCSVDKVKFLDLAAQYKKHGFRELWSTPFSSLVSEFADCYSDYPVNDPARDHLWNLRPEEKRIKGSECIVQLMRYARLPYRKKPIQAAEEEGAEVTLSKKLKPSEEGGGAAEEEGEEKADYQVVMVSSFLDKTLHLQ